MTSLKVGNDIVDLDHKDNNNKHNDKRFVSRVFTNTEQNAIDEADDPDLLLWSIWAAKETAYKIIKKIDPGFTLSYKGIEVDAAPIETQSKNDLHGKADGFVSIDGFTYAIRWMWTKHYVNCIGVSENHHAAIGGTSSSVRNVDDQLFCSQSTTSLTQRELSSCFSEESIRARFLAKNLLKEHGITKVEIIRERHDNRFGPPLLASRGNLAKTADISLSHDGEWISAALLI